MGETIYNLAFDFGASSGRMILSKYADGKIELEELHRFSNDPVRIGKNFYWDTFRLYHELKQGLKKAAARKLPIKSLAIDTWGVRRKVQVLRPPRGSAPALRKSGPVRKSHRRGNLPCRRG